MRKNVRTDLAAEATALWRETPDAEKLSGVEEKNYDRNGFPVTLVEITDPASGEKLGKPPGKYVCMDVTAYIEEGDLPPAAGALAQEIKALLPLDENAEVLVAGLGNLSVTPDAVGPLAVKSVLVTRHLRTQLPDLFSALRPVCAVAPGVLGTTGIESGDIVGAVSGKVRPAALIVIDALASRSIDRLCTTVQLSTGGIVPGSGVGNSRQKLSTEELGLPVLAIGVPTVVDAATLASDLLEKTGSDPSAADKLAEASGGLMVTPREIDTRVQAAAKLIAFGIDLALNPSLSIDEIAGYVS